VVGFDVDSTSRTGFLTPAPVVVWLFLEPSCVLYTLPLVKNKSDHIL